MKPRCRFGFPGCAERGRAGLILSGVLVALAGCSDGPAAPDPEFSPPRTGFEERAGAAFTTHAEELDFLAVVEAESDRVRTSVVGESVQGRPIQLVRVGRPLLDDGAIAAGPVVLVVGAQHGNEPAGREAALQFARDLAFVEEGELLDLLSGITVLVIPSANPDGRAANTRGNADGVDINRDHLRLASPEGRAIAQVLRDFRPDIVVDTHERPGGTTPEMELLWPRNLNVHPPIRDLSRELVEDHLFDDLVGLGRTVGIYGPGPGPPGDENETILRNASGLRHALGLLTESAGTRPAPDRVAAQMDVFLSVLRFRRERAGEVTSAVTEAPALRAAAGGDRSVPFRLFGADNDPPSSDEVLDPPPCAYRLAPGPVEELSTQRALWGLQTESLPGGAALLAMNQPSMTVIPMMVDPRARSPLAEGVPLVSESECAELEASPLRR